MGCLFSLHVHLLLHNNHFRIKRGPISVLCGGELMLKYLFLSEAKNGEQHVKNH